MRFLVRTQGGALRARESYDAQGALEKALFFAICTNPGRKGTFLCEITMVDGRRPEIEGRSPEKAASARIRVLFSNDF